MNHLDRHLAWSFIRAWLICFTSLVSLYVIIDLFNKLDDFLEITQGQGAVSLLATIASYYGCQVTVIFDRLCSVILMLAAMFTVGWLQRNNELIPLLAAGVPLRRILRPIWCVALVFIAVVLINREWLMPQLAPALQQSPREMRGIRLLGVSGSYEPDGVLLEGKLAHHQELLIEYFVATIPERVAGSLLVLQAREARYVPPSSERFSGGWLMTETVPADIPPLTNSRLTQIDAGKFFLKTEVVDFDVLTRGKAWHQYASLRALRKDLDRPGARYLQLISMQIHLRLTAPLHMLLMLALGLGMVLVNRDRHFLINAGMTLLTAGCFYGIQVAARHLGENEYLAPGLAAWLPILLFGPLAVVIHDSMPT